MDIFSNGYYKTNRIGLILIGIWPEQRLKQAYAVRLFIFGFLFSLLVPELIYLYEVVVGGSFMDDVLPCLTTQLSIFVAFTKFYMIASNRKTYQNAIDKMRNDWVLLSDSPASALMHKFAERGRFNTKLYMYALFVAMMFYFSFPMAPVFLDNVFPLNETRTRVPLFDAEYGFEHHNDHFFLQSLHAYTCVVFVIHMLWAIDSFIMIMVQHCCGLFEIVFFTVQRLNTENKKNSQEFEDELITYAISIHKRAILFAEFIEDSAKLMYAFVIFLNMILISLTGVETIMKLEYTEQALRFATFTYGEMAHLFFNSLPGQILVNHSTSVFDTIYDSDWYSLSLKSQKALLIMLMRSSKPSILTAGGIYELNMENFSQVVQTSMSYLTVLMSMR